MSIPPAVIRRVNRVRDRIDVAGEEPDEILDDIFVLWRAFEGTWSGYGGEREQAEEATIQTVHAHGMDSLPSVRAFVLSLRAFTTASADEFVQWFSSDQRSAADVKREVVSTIRSLREAIETRRWTENDSRKLGKLVYRMRCAIIHPSLDTHNSLALPVLPALRAALIELTISRAAAFYNVPLPDARHQFDLARGRL